VSAAEYFISRVAASLSRRRPPLGWMDGWARSETNAFIFLFSLSLSLITGAAFLSNYYYIQSGRNLLSKIPTRPRLSQREE
jgi:hypothetical protein